MDILLNGKKTEIKGAMTLARLLEEMKIVPEMTACEVNQRIVKRCDAAKTVLSDGDEVEILQMIGGG